MNLNCNKCNRCFLVSENDLVRIEEEVINRNFSTLLITCSECEKRTSWFHGMEECEHDIVIKENLKKNAIPETYLSILKTAQKLEIALFEDEENFILYSESQLLNLISINETSYYQVSEILGYIDTIIEFSIGDITSEIELMENSVTIGYENTRVLFIDTREKNSPLYVFHPDGGDIDKTHLTLTDLIKALNC